MSELESLRRSDVLLILFPQGHRGNADVAGQLRAMNWTEPFVYDHLAEPYTTSLLSTGTPLPAVLLQTADGRALLETRWSRATARADRRGAPLSNGLVEKRVTGFRSGAPALHCELKV